MCTGCDKHCQVEKLQKELEKERTWVYVAYGFLPKVSTNSFRRKK